MSLLAIAHAVLGQPMQKRFAADPELKATMLLLQERTPRSAINWSSDPAMVDVRSRAGRVADRRARLLASRHAPAGGAAADQRPLPGHGHQQRRRLQPLARSGDHALARGCDARSVGRVLLSARRRNRKGLVEHARADADGRRLSPKRSSPSRPVEFRRRLDDIEAHTQIVVSPEDDIELRRIRIINRARVARTIEVTSYAEVVLASGIARLAASGVRQSLRADRSAGRPRLDTGDAAAADPAKIRSAG